MQRNARRLVSTAAGLVLAAGTLIGGSTAASASEADSRSKDGVASCYGSAKAYSKPAGQDFYPDNGASTLTTTTNCADINIKTNTNRYVAVCFWKSTGGWLCNQDHWTYAKAGQWTTVARSVLNGSRFVFSFRSDAKSTGHWAA
ncbi:hypothetical protein [Streptomyces sp. NPDC053079]|uniref:hypothetical protein n=1 Tax=Streptomyces sp. NPDC053079 TaxID=3365697 RepID=UPI0037D9733C